MSITGVVSDNNPKPLYGRSDRLPTVHISPRRVRPWSPGSMSVSLDRPPHDNVPKRPMFCTGQVVTEMGASLRLRVGKIAPCAALRAGQPETAPSSRHVRRTFALSVAQPTTDALSSGRASRRPCASARGCGGDRGSARRARRASGARSGATSSPGRFYAPPVGSIATTRGPGPPRGFEVHTVACRPRTTEPQKRGRLSKKEPSARERQRR